MYTMIQATDPFWKTKTLQEMTPDEWESLCDHCGMCVHPKDIEENLRELKLYESGEG